MRQKIVRPYKCFQQFEDLSKECLAVNKVKFGERKWLANTHYTLTLTYPSSASTELETLLTKKGHILFSKKLINNGMDIQNRLYFKEISSIGEVISFLTENKKVSSNLCDEVQKSLTAYEKLSSKINSIVSAGAIDLSFKPKGMTPEILRF